jgi:hypothetical protein
MYKQILNNAGYYNAAKNLKQYTLEDSQGNLLATIVQKTIDGDIHEILWYGGQRHGKSSLTEGGLEGLMNFVGENVPEIEEVYSPDSRSYSVYGI